MYKHFMKYVTAILLLMCALGLCIYFQYSDTAKTAAKDGTYYYVTDGYGIYAAIGIDDWSQPDYVKSNALLKESKFHEAIIQLEKLSGMNNLSEEQKVIAANNLGVAYACFGDHLTAEQLLKERIPNSHTWDDAVHNNLGILSGYMENDSETSDYFQPLSENEDIKRSLLGAVVRSNQLHFLSSNTRDEKRVLIEKENRFLGRYDLVSAVNNLGIASDIMDFDIIRSQGDPSGMDEYLDQAESINSSVLNNPLLQIRIYEMRALAYRISGNDTEREKQIEEALRMLKNTGLEKSTAAIDIYSQSIALQKEKGNYTLALQETLRALELSKSQPKRMEFIYSRISSIAELQNNADETVVWILKAYQLFNRLEGADDVKSLKNEAEKDLLTIYEQEDYGGKYGLTFEEWLNESLDMEQVPPL